MVSTPDYRKSMRFEHKSTVILAHEHFLKWLTRIIA